MNVYYSLVLVTLSVLLLVWGSFVLASSSKRGRLNIVYFLMSMSGFVWAGSLGIEMICPRAHALFWANASLFGSLMLCASAFTFMMAFFAESWIYRFGRFLAPFFGLVAWLIKVFGHATTIVDTKYGPFYIDTKSIPSLIFFAYIAVLAFWTLVAATILFFKAQIKRQRILLLMWMALDSALLVLMIIPPIIRVYNKIPTEPSEGFMVIALCVVYYLIARGLGMLDYSELQITEFISTSMSSPVFFAKRQGDILFYNNAFVEVFCGGDRSVVQSNIRNVPATKYFPIQQMLVDLYEKKMDSNTYAMEYEVDGVLHKYEVYVDAIKDRFGDALAFACTAHDVTELQKLIAENSEQRDIAEKARKKAEGANRAKMHFLANVSHELRTPMNTIIGMNEMIEREASSETVRDYSRRVDVAGKVLMSIINDILDYSDIESGEIQLKNEEYDVMSMLKSLYDIVHAQVKEKSIQIRFEIAGDLPSRLIGDRERLRQVFANLLSNSAKYTNEGSITFKVEWAQIDAEHVELITEVIDTGAGIPKENMERMFDAFERLETEDSHTISGTGLGLSINRLIVDSMEGTIDADSVQGVGTTFHVRVPQGLASLQPIENIQAKLRAMPEQRVDENANYIAPEAKILIVDDNKVNLMVVSALIRNLNAKVTTCRSGMECLSLNETERYDVIFLDHMMPEMDGIETIHKLRDMEGAYYQEVPVIAFTANAAKEMEQQFLDAGMNDFIFKPVRGDEMKNMIRKWLPAERIVPLTADGEEIKSPENETIRSAADVESLLNKIKANEEKQEEVKKDDYIDERKAIRLVGGNRRIFEQSALIFANRIPEQEKLIGVHEVDEDETKLALDLYTLKTSAETIGATKLVEEMAPILEALEKKDFALIHRRMPEFLALYRKYSEVLKVYEPHLAEGENVLSKREMLAIADSILTAIEAYDVDAIDRYVQQLASHSWSKEYHYYVQEIRNTALNVQYDICAEWTRQFADRIELNEK